MRKLKRPSANDIRELLGHGEQKRGKVMKTRWITALINRHPDLGGGLVEADMPDTPTNRAAVVQVLKTWTQTFDGEGRAIACTK